MDNIFKIKKEERLFALVAFLLIVALQRADGNLPLCRFQQEWKCRLLDHLYQKFGSIGVRPIYLSHTLQMESVLYGIQASDASLLSLSFDDVQ